MLGRNLDLITEVQLGRGEIRVPVSHRGSKSLLILTVPTGVASGAYIIYYQTRQQTVNTERTLIVGGSPPPTSISAAPTFTPVPPVSTPTPVPAAPTATSTPVPAEATPPVASESEPIVVARLEWESAKIHAAIVSFIIESGYGNPTEIATGTTESLWEELIEGSVDVYLEAWTTSLGPRYEEAVDQGLIIPLGQSLDDAWESAFVVPTYVIEGDSSRDIEPVAPDLRSPQDIRQYQDLFATRTTFPKARFVSCLSEWACLESNEQKISSYGLKDAVQAHISHMAEYPSE